MLEKRDAGRCACRSEKQESEGGQAENPFGLSLKLDNVSVPLQVYRSVFSDSGPLECNKHNFCFVEMALTSLCFWKILSTKKLSF